jgi:hypothetical protein
MEEALRRVLHLLRVDLLEIPTISRYRRSGLIPTLRER